MSASSDRFRMGENGGSSALSGAILNVFLVSIEVSARFRCCFSTVRRGRTRLVSAHAVCNGSNCCCLGLHVGRPVLSEAPGDKENVTRVQGQAFNGLISSNGTGSAGVLLPITGVLSVTVVWEWLHASASMPPLTQISQTLQRFFTWSVPGGGKPHESQGSCTKALNEEGALHRVPKRRPKHVLASIPSKTRVSQKRQCIS